ncbi:hypothetical protein BZG02_15425 [Labilibaculum filiforme]|uniref:Uncharacterized protein n=1 Tax=Labilibaculum filiforme TaxID=1940526 RepID=A0A2N3HU67_9BACT|nr:hypothetical protein [Labilibaculum filiforme]PKQ61578.1 hypothetical protein BZG02_15425 [Labilibaculum filiforme]
MKKTRLFFQLIGIGVFAISLLIISCTKEGPMGPAGADGTNGIDGTDGNSTCLDCHATETKSSIDAQFAMSVHSSGINAVDYAGGRASCAACHSHQGFVQFANTGAVAGDITNPTAWECATCHGLHESFEGKDYALRLKDPVKPIFDPSITMDLNGSSNLCANCHQSRRAEPIIDKPGDTYTITSTHYGPHHGAQANVVAGVGFAEIAGSVAYPAAGSAVHLAQASCTGCHMSEFDDAKDQGGHTYNPSLLACNTCHGVEEDDFNYGGVQSIVEGQLETLRDELVRLGVVAWVEADAAYEPVVGTYPMVQARAFFNWAGLDEDRSLGVHNPKYVKALLQNSIEALEAIPDPS